MGITTSWAVWVLKEATNLEISIKRLDIEHTQVMCTECDISPSHLITKTKRGVESGLRPEPPHSIACHFLQEGGVQAPFPTQHPSGREFRRGTGAGDCQILSGSLPPLHTITTLSFTQRSAGRLHHSVLSPILQGTAETTAVIQLWNPAQPPTGPVPETGSWKHCACLPDTGEGWPPGAGAGPGLVSALCGKDCRESCEGSLLPFIAWKTGGRV